MNHVNINSLGQRSFTVHKIVEEANFHDSLPRTFYMCSTFYVAHKERAYQDRRIEILLRRSFKKVLYQHALE